MNIIKKISVMVLLISLSMTTFSSSAPCSSDSNAPFLNVYNKMTGANAVPIQVWFKNGQSPNYCVGDIADLINTINTPNTAITIQPGENLVNALANSTRTIPNSNKKLYQLTMDPNYGVVVEIDKNAKSNSCNIVTMTSWKSRVNQKTYNTSFINQYICPSSSTSKGTVSAVTQPIAN